MSGDSTVGRRKPRLQRVVHLKRVPDRSSLSPHRRRLEFGLSIGFSVCYSIKCALRTKEDAANTGNEASDVQGITRASQKLELPVVRIGKKKNEQI